MTQNGKSKKQFYVRGASYKWDLYLENYPEDIGYNLYTDQTL